MSGYILSVLGIVLAGVIIDVILPSGSINKYIKSIYAIFVVAVLINPVVKFLTKGGGFKFQYDEYNLNGNLLNYVYNNRVENLENKIETKLNDNGFKNIDIKINYSIKNNELTINSCTANLKNMVIDSDKQHINKYEFIKEAIKEHTNLTDEVIIFYE